MGRKIAESKISQRGSLVLPKVVREFIDVSEGDTVQWELEILDDGQITIDINKKKAK